jgi:hypothetical protein
VTTQEIARLRDDTNKVISGLSPKSVSGAINWGDLGCVSARYWTDSDGESGLQVVVEEASPNSGELSAAIQNGLARLNWIGPIEVITEW